MAANDWSFVYDFMKSNKKYFEQNKIEFERISTLIAGEYIRYIPSEKPVLILNLSQKFIILNRSHLVFFTDEQLIAIERLTLSILDDKDALSFAKGFCKHSKEAKVILADIKEKYSVTEKSKDMLETPSLSKASAIPRVDWLSPLFKSSQELEFYQALKSVYPNHFIYPNVALSNIFDFDSLKSGISAEARKYFFTAVVDFVVYDPSDFHEPKYFFEVDSHYHDTAKAQAKDKMKNDIFLLANIPLHRIRLDEFTNTPRSEFISKIKALSP